ncbi:MAG: flagellar hook-associated protein FlgK [Pseudomonadota bacterium]
MASLFNIGVSGLRAQQSALNIVGQNITNASTEGYSRQRVELVSQVPSSSAGLVPGAGVQVKQVERIADAYIDQQIRTDSALHAELTAFTDRISQLEGTLFDSQFGIDSGIQDFFDAMQNAANEPSDLAMRQFVLSSADALVNRFHSVTDRSWLQARDITGALESASVRVNELAGLLVQVNERIAGLQSSNDSGALNLMIDRRDLLLKELSEFVAIDTSEQGDGQVNVFIGKGQPLVLGGEAARMEITGDGDITLRAVGAQGSQVVTNSITGGEIGGILKYREDVLWPTQNELGRLAAAISIAFNEQHQQGVDLEGQFGADFFRDVNDPELVRQRVDYLGGQSVNGDSTQVGRINVYIDDPFQSAATDYEVRFSEANPGAYTITRRNDGEIVLQGSSLTPPTEVSFDGLRVEFASGEFTPGTALLLRPYADFGSQFDVSLQDPSQVALASPVQVSADPTNQGTAELLVNSITDGEHPLFAEGGTLMPPLLIRFVSDTEYQVLDNSNPGRPVPLEPDLGLQTYLAGAQNQLLPTAPGTSLVSTSGPAVNSLPGQTDLVSNLDAGSNRYPAGLITVDYTKSEFAGTFTGNTRSATLNADASAREIAQQLNALPGVKASAQTALTLQNLVNFESGTPVELAVNGQLLTGFADLTELADAITENATLAQQGIVARSDGQSLVLESLYGDDLTLHFQGDPNESITVANSKGEQIDLRGNLPGSYRTLTVGGEVSTILEPGIEMTTQYTGVFAANPEHARADLGFDLLLSGNVAAGDEFSVGFNTGGIADNRNALLLASLSDQALVGDPKRSFSGVFGALVQEVGVQSAQGQISRDAAGVLLEQSEAFRESVSGVNLDEEAASLIRYEQAYNAAAQVITVARDIFNVLLNSVS